MEDEVDIHGTNWAEHQRVFKIEGDPADRKLLHLHLSVPLKDGQIATLLEHLRTWHP